MNNEIASELLKIKAFIFRPENPFIWASGIKSPVYCDNRLSLSYPESREKIVTSFIDLITKSFPQVDIIAGVATAGIPYASMIADRMNLPLVYVRSKSKDHGKGNKIEGEITGRNMVVVEDLFSTGGSAIDAVLTLRQEKIDVLGMVSVFSYETSKLLQNSVDNKIIYKSLTTLDQLIKMAIKSNYLDERYLKEINQWKNTL